MIRLRPSQQKVPVKPTSGAPRRPRSSSFALAQTDLTRVVRWVRVLQGRYRAKSDVAHTLRMTDMESKAQEQVLGTPDHSYWFQVIYEDVNFAYGVINASLCSQKHCIGRPR